MMGTHDFFSKAAEQRKRELVGLAVSGGHGLAELVVSAPIKTDTCLPSQEKPAKYYRITIAYLRN